MSKRLALKDFLNLAETAELIGSHWREDVSVSDVLYYITQKQLEIYWTLYEHPSNSVTWRSNLEQKISGKISNTCNTAVCLLGGKPCRIYDDGTIIHYESLDYCDPNPDYSICRLTGHFKVDLTLNAGLFNFLMAKSMNHEYQPAKYKPTFIVNNASGSAYLLKVSKEFTPGLHNEKYNRIASTRDEQERRLLKDNLIDDFLKEIANECISLELKRECITDYIENVESINFGDFRKSRPTRTVFEDRTSFPELSEFVLPREDIESFAKSHSKAGNSMAPQQKNTMLRLIRSLTLALIGESTGSSFKDAECALVAAKNRGIDLDISERTLKKYLDDAEGVNKSK